MEKNLDDMLDQLHSLTKGMDVPSHMRRKPKWLVSKMGKRNPDHPNFEEALSLAKELVSAGL